MFGTITLAGVKGLALKGWGQLIRARFGADDTFAARDWSVDIVCSVYLVLLLGQAAPFFVTLNSSIGITLVVSGLAAVLWRGYTRFARTTWFLVGSIATVFGILTAILTLHSLFLYDAGLYQLGFIQWMAEKGTVLGLANVHGRFGFNSSWLSGAALFANKDPNWYFGPLVWSIAGPLMLYLALIDKAAWAAHSGRKLCSAFCILTPTLLLFFPGTTAFLTITQTDLPAALLVLHALASAISLHETPVKQRQAPHFLALALPVAAAFTVKLSAAPVVLLCAPTAWAWRSNRVAWRDIAPAVIALVSLPVVWVAQNFALSGCAVYPVAATCAPLPWTVDNELVSSDAAWIVAWARKPQTELSDPYFIGYHWVGDWIATNWRILVDLGLAVAVGGVLSVAGIWSGRRRNEVGVILWPLTVTVLGILMWFVSAPDPRFGIGFIVGLSALALSVGASFWPLSIFMSVVVCLALMQTSQFVLILAAKPTETFSKGPPRPTLTVKSTDSGLQVAVPTKNDQCWIAELPCTPYFNPKLTKGRFGNYETFYLKGSN
jgi:hypothetical protein